MRIENSIKHPRRSFKDENSQAVNCFRKKPLSQTFD